MVIMTCASGTGDAALREWLPRLWRRIEDAHYSYLETDDSPEKLQQKKKLEDYIMEYLARAPHECRFRLAETNKVFQRTVNELPDFNAYKVGIGWAAIARYAGNLLTQPWRKEYRVIRLYSGFFKHEVEANIVGAESLLVALGYSPAGAGRLALRAPLCPDTAAAISRDALVAHCEAREKERSNRKERSLPYNQGLLLFKEKGYRIMCEIWESVVSSGNRGVTWGDIYRARAARADRPAAAAARLLARDLPYIDTGSEIYSNIPTTVTDTHCSRIDARYHNHQPIPPNQSCHYCPEDAVLDDAMNMPQFMMPQNMIPQYNMYPMGHPDVPQCSTVPMMTQYVPYYYPVQAPYMIPTPVYPSIKHAATVPINGYPPYRYPAVPTAQLIELDSSVYENDIEDRHKMMENLRRNSTSKSGFSDVTLPSLPRSDTQPALSKAREDGMGTYESWDYVFRNLSSKDRDEDSRNRYSPSLDRDSRTLDRLDKAHKSRYQPTTLDLEDGLQALSLDHRVEELKKDLKKSKQTKRLQVDEKKTKRQIEPVGNPKADALITPKVAPDKVKLLTKKEIRDRKDIIKQQNSVNGTSSSTAEIKKVKKPTKLVAAEVEKPSRPRPVENGTPNTVHVSSKSSSASSVQPNFDLKAQLVVTLDETDSRHSPSKATNGDRPHSRTSSTHHEQRSESRTNKWECGTCTYINKNSVAACEMCGKSKKGPEIQPLTSGGRECPACTLVNQREAKVCDACGTSLDHCPTYI